MEVLVVEVLVEAELELDSNMKGGKPMMVHCTECAKKGSCLKFKEMLVKSMLVDCKDFHKCVVIEEEDTSPRRSSSSDDDDSNSGGGFGGGGFGGGGFGGDGGGFGGFGGGMSGGGGAGEGF